MTWEFDLAWGAHWEKTSDTFWILVDEDGRYIARVIGDIPEEIRDSK